MRLSFLGKSYTASIPDIEAIDSQEIATFMGRRYTRKQFNVPERYQPKTTLTYRGIKYTR